MSQILIRNAGEYVRQYSQQAAPQVQSTLAKLSLCRTEALGGHEYRCGQCKKSVVIPNSCGDRHCPKCNGARKRNWLDSANELILDGVDHFQVVFTLPDKLSRLSLGNRTAIYDLLFASSWSALKQVIASEHGSEAAALMVLHTWNQKLDAHAHVHAVVPGCGLALDGGAPVFAQRGDDESTRGRYLVDADELRSVYRTQFISGLARLHRRGELRLEGEFELLQHEDVWDSFLDELEGVTWVSFIQPPPVPGQSADQVLKYLARYLGGGPISDHRIRSTDATSVTFLARHGTTSGGDSSKEPMTLSQVEFTRRWCLHILPDGYTRTRRYGMWSNQRRERDLERLAIQLAQSDLPLTKDALEFGPFDDSDDSTENGSSAPELCCPTCQTALIPHRVTEKPSWSILMNSGYRPLWYLRR